MSGPISAWFPTKSTGACGPCDDCSLGIDGSPPRPATRRPSPSVERKTGEASRRSTSSEALALARASAVGASKPLTKSVLVAAVRLVMLDRSRSCVSEIPSSRRGEWPESDSVSAALGRSRASRRPSSTLGSNRSATDAMMCTGSVSLANCLGEATDAAACLSMSTR
eukprot:2355015-Prymnesium_polylepis.2